jgi:hypothetical protein
MIEHRILNDTNTEVIIEECMKRKKYMNLLNEIDAKQLISKETYLKASKSISIIALLRFFFMVHAGSKIFRNITVLETFLMDFFDEVTRI